MIREPIVTIRTNTIEERTKGIYILAASLVIFLLTLLTQLFITNDLAIKGKEIVDLDIKRVALEKEISVMQLEQSNFSSLSKIEERALKLGFEKNNQYAKAINTTVDTAALFTGNKSL